MAIMLDQVSRMLRVSRPSDRASCIVCRRPIGDGERRMTVRGSVQVHHRCATYRMRQIDSGVRRVGYPPR
jgi:hypothetical protein